MHMPRLALLAPLAALALAACSQADDTAPADDAAMSAPAMPGSATGGDGAAPPAPTLTETGDQTEADQCGAGKTGHFVGQEATPAVRAEVQAEVGHSSIRWVGPDTMVTEDYSPQRLNMAMDAADVITGASCG
jgi:hypothetical protein